MNSTQDDKHNGFHIVNATHNQARTIFKNILINLVAETFQKHRQSSNKKQIQKRVQLTNKKKVQSRNERKVRDETCHHQSRAAKCCAAHEAETARERESRAPAVCHRSLGGVSPLSVRVVCRVSVTRQGPLGYLATSCAHVSGGESRGRRRSERGLRDR